MKRGASILAVSAVLAITAVVAWPVTRVLLGIRDGESEARSSFEALRRVAVNTVADPAALAGEPWKAAAIEAWNRDGRLLAMTVSAPGQGVVFAMPGDSRFYGDEPALARGSSVRGFTGPLSSGMTIRAWYTTLRRVDVFLPLRDATVALLAMLAAAAAWLIAASSRPAPAETAARAAEASVPDATPVPAPMEPAAAPPAVIPAPPLTPTPTEPAAVPPAVILAPPTTPIPVEPAAVPPAVILTPPITPTPMETAAAPPVMILAPPMEPVAIQPTVNLAPPVAPVSVEPPYAPPEAVPVQPATAAPPAIPTRAAAPLVVSSRPLEPPAAPAPSPSTAGSASVVMPLVPVDAPLTITDVDRPEPENDGYDIPDIDGNFDMELPDIGDMPPPSAVDSLTDDDLVLVEEDDDIEPAESEHTPMEAVRAPVAPPAPTESVRIKMAPETVEPEFASPELPEPVELEPPRPVVESTRPSPTRDDEPPVEPVAEPHDLPRSSSRPVPPPPTVGRHSTVGSVGTADLPKDALEGPHGLYEPESGLGWESYLRDRLGAELKRAASFEQDLCLLIASLDDSKRGDEDYNIFSRVTQDFFSFKDLSFQFGKSGLAAILPNMDIDHAIRMSEELLKKLTFLIQGRSGPMRYLELFMGISSRSGRLVDADRLIGETMAALNKAREERDTHIMAFRPDPEKFRAYLAAR